MSLFKRINRGVILIVAVVLVVWGYELSVYYQNKPYMDAVKPLITQYLDVYSKYSILPEEYRGADKVVPEDKFKEMSTNCENELKNLFVTESKKPAQIGKSIVQQTCYGTTTEYYKLWFTNLKYSFDKFKNVERINDKFMAGVKTFMTFTRSGVDLKTQRSISDTEKQHSSNPKGIASNMRFNFVKKDNRWYIINSQFV